MAKLNLRFVVIALGFLGAPGCFAVNLSIEIEATDPSVEDSAYPGTGSTVTTLTDRQTAITVSIAGRDYGANPAAGSERWGIRAAQTPWRALQLPLWGISQDGFLVNGGFSPSATGSTRSASGTGASYVSITLAGVLPNTLFENVSLDVRGISTAGTTNAWGAASVGGFTNWSVANQNGNGRRLTLDLADFTWTGGDPVEIRLYGLTGLDEGEFTSVSLRARLTSLPPVPEPPAAMLLGSAVFLVGDRRRRPLRPSLR